MNQEIRELLDFLPPDIYRAVSKIEGLSEIRLRAGRRVCAFDGIKNIVCEAFTDKRSIESILSVLCKNSLYSYMDSINEGYIPYKNGVRIGVCGKAYVENEKIKSISDISSVSIRIPRSFDGISDPLYAQIKARRFRDSLLIYSPPGVGKTTVIRDLAKSLAVGDPCKRVCIIDSRREIETLRLSHSDCVDIYSGYPKAEGISIATRTMNPEYIVCDEIGGYDEVSSLLSAQNAGVPIIATAHASDIKELLYRKNIRKLHDNFVFTAYVGIKRSAEGSGKNEYVWDLREDL